MKIGYGGGKTEHGPGVDIKLTGDEVAEAIDLWLKRVGNVATSGPRTITINGSLCKYGLVYIDPSGSVQTSVGVFLGQGEKPVTRKYEEEYKAYQNWLASLGEVYKPLSYSEWFKFWDAENPKRQAIMLQAYNFISEQSTHHEQRTTSNTTSSLQERDAVTSALCFDLYVSPRT